jgi:hypothetical protein
LWIVTPILYFILYIYIFICFYLFVYQKKANIEEKVRIRVKSEVSKKHWENKLASEKERIASISSEVDKKKRILEVFIISFIKFKYIYNFII